MREAEQRDRVGAAGFSEFCFSEIHRKSVAGLAERLATGSPRGGQAIAILHPTPPLSWSGDWGMQSANFRATPPLNLVGQETVATHHHQAFSPSHHENKLSPSLLYAYSIEIVFRYAYLLRFPYGFSKGLTVSCPSFTLPSHFPI